MYVNYQTKNNDRYTVDNRPSIPYISIDKSFDTFRDLNADERKRVFFVKAVNDRKTGFPYVKIFWLNGLLMEELYDYIEDPNVMCFSCPPMIEEE